MSAPHSPWQLVAKVWKQVPSFFWKWDLLPAGTRLQPRSQAALPQAPHLGTRTGWSTAGPCSPPHSGTRRPGCTWPPRPSSGWRLGGGERERERNCVLPFPVSPSLRVIWLEFWGRCTGSGLRPTQGASPQPAVAEPHLFKPQLPDNPGTNKP